ncbi:hypothetical protein [Ketogulonicigenium vulgare]|uniref:hypothetical protein n=1 Tax=Ketogulonicigenium vulgare TaxID=92945 RepID=UPI0011E06AB7|nr:hypothetical protein [Ketogulonicigenium vulgare]
MKKRTVPLPPHDPPITSLTGMSGCTLISADDCSLRAPDLFLRPTFRRLPSGAVGPPSSDRSVEAPVETCLDSAGYFASSGHRWIVKVTFVNCSTLPWDQEIALGFHGTQWVLLESA